jgi:hypothetical protein
MSQEDQDKRAQQQRHGLSILAETAGFSTLLGFPASCYATEIRELQETDTAALAKGKGMVDQKEILEAKTSFIQDWGHRNLWAIPLELPNSRDLPYGLIWASIPADRVPKTFSEWLLMDPITGRKGSIVRVTMAPFAVGADLWASVGLAALLQRRVFEALPLD